MFSREFDSRFSTKITGRYVTSFDENGDGYHSTNRTQDVAFIQPNTLHLSLIPEIKLALLQKVPLACVDKIMEFYPEKCYNKIMLALASQHLVEKRYLPIQDRVPVSTLVSHLSEITRCHLILINGSNIYTINPKGRIRFDLIVSIVVRNENLFFNNRTIISDKYCNNSIWVHGKAARGVRELEYLRDMEILMSYFRHDGKLSRPFRPAKSNLKRTDYEVLMICCKQRFDFWDLGSFYWKVDERRAGRVKYNIDQLEMERESYSIRNKLILPDLKIEEVVRTLHTVIQVEDKLAIENNIKERERYEREMMAREDIDVAKLIPIDPFIEKNFSLADINSKAIQMSVWTIENHIKNGRIKKADIASERKHAKTLEGAVKNLEGKVLEDYKKAKMISDTFNVLNNKDRLIEEEKEYSRQSYQISREVQEYKRNGVEVPFELRERRRALNKTMYKETAGLTRVQNAQLDKREFLMDVESAVSDDGDKWVVKLKKTEDQMMKERREKDPRQLFFEVKKPYIMPEIKSVLKVDYNKDRITKKTIGMRVADEWQNVANLNMEKIIKNYGTISAYEGGSQRRRRNRPVNNGRWTAHQDRILKYSKRLSKVVKNNHSERIQRDLLDKKSEPRHDLSQNITMRSIMHMAGKLGVPNQFACLDYNDLLLAFSRSQVSESTQRVANYKSKFGTHSRHRHFAAQVIKAITVSKSLENVSRVNIS